MYRRRSLKRLAVSLVIALVMVMLTGALTAGAVGPEITGTVSDAATGAPVPGCLVEVERLNPGTGEWDLLAFDQANPVGVYMFDGIVTVGEEYRTVILAGGYEQYTSPGVTYNGTTLVIDAELDAWPTAGYPVATGPGWVDRPRASGDIVVWGDSREGEYDIYAFDFSSFEETRVTSATGEQSDPDVCGDWVVYYDYRHGSGDIYATNLSTGEERAVRVDAAHQQRPKISGTWVVWEDFRNGWDGEIYAYDLASGTEYLVASGRFPDIHGTHVAYYNGSKAYYRDLADLGQDAVLMGDMYEHVSLTGGYAVYDRIVDDGSGGDKRTLVAYDLAAGTEAVLPLPSVYYNTGGFEVDGTTLAYFAESEDGNDVFTYDLVKHDIIPVADGWWDEAWPTVSGNTVVWIDSRDYHPLFGGDTSLYANRPTAPDATPPSTTHTVEPAAPNGGDGWYLFRVSGQSPPQPPLITLSVDESATTYFHWESEDAAVYTEPLLMRPGANTLSYASVDLADNRETTTTVTFKYDPSGPTAPGNVTATALSPTTVRVSWTASTDAYSGVAAYYVSRVSPGPYTRVAEVSAAVTSVDITGLTPGTAYTFDVFAGDVARWGGSAAQASVTTPSDALVTTPIQGDNRYTTAIAASKKAFPAGSVTTVVIATGANWPDALGGASLAGAAKGPILLTAPNALPGEVLAEIDRLGATKAYILGGTPAVSSAVETNLKTKLGAGNVTRLGGQTRYDTAGLIAKEAIRLLKASPAGYDGTAFIATGLNFPDALGASPLAAAKGWPIYLSNPGQGDNAALISTMKTDGATKAIVLGGTNVVAASIETKARTTLGTALRLHGPTRYDTAVAIATYGVNPAGAGLSWNKVAIATGANFPDALAGGVLQGKDGSVMLLTPPTVLNGTVKTTLSANKATIHEVRFLGGTSAVSTGVRTEVINALK